ncbi:MAG: NAD-binding protein, partial [Mailhella sp.]|nr:NAD-binding protein [Mailhella sp.]
MKVITSILAWLRKKENSQRNATRFMRFSLALLLLIVLYSIAFHVLMDMEGRSYSWITGLYWTLTVMSTLGFGDITFMSDIGKLFSIVVLITGIIFLLVMLPYAFIEYVYSPWMEQQKKNRIPREVPPDISDHIIVVGVTPISTNLVRRLEQFGFYCVMLTQDIQTTLDLEEQGFHAVAGDYDDEETYGRLRLKEAGALIALDTDQRNSNIIFSARAAD